MASQHWVQAYCDGSCIHSRKAGGWGVLLLWKGKKKVLSGFVPGATNNQMELRAVIEGLRALKSPGTKVVVYTDSQYVRNGITKWVLKWVRNGWLTYDKRDVANKELWVDLIALCKEHVVEWNWIPGHVGNPFHNVADRAAYDAARSGGIELAE